MTTHAKHGYSKQPTNLVTEKQKRYAPQFMQDVQIDSHTTHASPCSELVLELRVHSDQGATSLAEDNAQLVLLPVDLLKQ